MSIISHLEATVLGLLCEGSCYGYELEKIIEERGMRNWTEIGFSSIYYVLKRLENKGLIRSKMKEVEGKPSRRVYTVTGEGKKIMKEKVRALLSKNEKIISPFDLGLAYLHLLEPEEVHKCLRLYLESIDKRLTFLEDSIRGKEKSGAPYHVVALFTRPHAHVKTEKLWVRQFVKKIEEKAFHMLNNAIK